MNQIFQKEGVVLNVLFDQMQLTFLAEQGFKTKYIAKVFNCSRRTIEHRMSEYCIEGKIFSSLTWM